MQQDSTVNSNTTDPQKQHPQQRLHGGMRKRFSSGEGRDTLSKPVPASSSCFFSPVIVFLVHISQPTFDVLRPRVGLRWAERTGGAETEKF